jgi:hypothetical protein
MMSFSFRYLRFFFFFSCVSQPVFRQTSVVLAIDCIALIAMCISVSSGTTLLPLCNHIHAKRDCVG